MAMEPITLFSRIADPALVARYLRRRVPAVEIDGPDDAWQNAVVTFHDGQDRWTLTFTHDPDYYADPNWSRQMAGMRGYFQRFPETDRQSRVLTLTTSLKFSLGTLFEPDFDPTGDPRLEVLFELTELLDGVLFTPSGLRDANGRVLYGSGGEEEEDSDAVWPKVLGEVSLNDPAGQAMHEQSRPRPDGEEDDELLDPPTAERVARRAVALAAVTFRAILEQNPEDPDHVTNFENLQSWLEELAIDDEFEPDEQAVLQTPLGELDQQQQINATWRLEGLVVLAWALGRFEIPPHDELVELNPLWRSLHLMELDEVRELLAHPTLRSPEEINTQRNRLFAIHWRLRNYQINPSLMDFADFARTCWFGPLDITDLPLVKGDLGIGGERLDEADPDILGATHSAAQERHQAINWLHEGPAEYSAASVAT